MELTPYLQQLREDFLAAAAVGDENIRQAAGILSSAIEPSARLALMSALSDFAAEVTAALESASVEVRLDGRDVKVTVTGHSRDADRSTDRADWGADGHGDDLRKAMQEAGGELSRTTVRLWNDLKTQAERAAAEQGVSLNSYISRAVSNSVRSSGPGRERHRGKGGPGRSMTGYIES